MKQYTKSVLYPIGFSVPFFRRSYIRRGVFIYLTLLCVCIFSSVQASSEGVLRVIYQKNAFFLRQGKIEKEYSLKNHKKVTLGIENLLSQYPLGFMKKDGAKKDGLKITQRAFLLVLETYAMDKELTIYEFADRCKELETQKEILIEKISDLILREPALAPLLKNAQTALEKNLFDTYQQTLASFTDASQKEIFAGITSLQVIDLLNRNLYAEALERVNKVTNLSSTDTFFILKAEVLEKNNQTSEALLLCKELFKDSLKLSTLQKARIWSILASAHQRLRQEKQAKICMEQSLLLLELDRTTPPKVLIPYLEKMVQVAKHAFAYLTARDAQKKLVSIYEHLWGADDIYTLRSNAELALIVSHLGAYEEAKKIFQHIIHICERKNGIEKVSVIDYYVELAEILKNLRDTEGAKESLEKAVLQSEKIFGKTHSQTSAMYAHLGLLLQEMGELKRAKQLLEDAAQIEEKNTDKKDPALAIRYNDLAMVLKDLGDYDNAKKLLFKSIQLDETNFGKEYPGLSRTYSNLAILLKEWGDFDEAKTYLEKAVLIAEKNFGTEHPSTAIRYATLATVLSGFGENEAARTLLEKAVFSAEKYFGHDNPYTAVRYTQLAMVLKELGEYEKAKFFLQKAILSAEKNFGPFHPITGTRYSNLGLMLEHMGLLQEAKTYIEKSAHAAEKSLGTENSVTLIRYSYMAKVLKELGDYLNALMYAKKAEVTFKKNLPMGDPNIRNIEDMIEEIEEAMNQKK